MSDDGTADREALSSRVDRVQALPLDERARAYGELYNELAATLDASDGGRRDR